MIAVDIGVVVVAFAIGVVFPRWWLVVPSMAPMAVGILFTVPGGIGLIWSPFALALGIAGRQAANRLRRHKSLRRPTSSTLAGLALFTGLMSAEIYVIENTTRVNSSFWGWVGLFLVLGAFLGGGLLVGEWWAALLLPLLAVLLSWPAGENQAISGDIPWVGFIFVFAFPVFAVLVAIAVGARKLFGRRRAPNQRARAA